MSGFLSWPNLGHIKILRSRFTVLILELIDSKLRIKIFKVWILIMIKYMPHQNFRHWDYDLTILIVELGISFDRLCSHHQLVYRSIMEDGISSG
jgi:hypothetical protein